MQGGPAAGSLGNPHETRVSTNYIIPPSNSNVNSYTHIQTVYTLVHLHCIMLMYVPGVNLVILIVHCSTKGWKKIYIYFMYSLMSCVTTVWRESFGGKVLAGKLWRENSPLNIHVLVGDLIGFRHCSWQPSLPQFLPTTSNWMPCFDRLKSSSSMHVSHTHTFPYARQALQSCCFAYLH